ncbi:hypothetical protein D3C81_1846700 [compost metagenome]
MKMGCTPQTMKEVQAMKISAARSSLESCVMGTPTRHLFLLCVATCPKGAVAGGEAGLGGNRGPTLRALKVNYRHPRQWAF